MESMTTKEKILSQDDVDAILAQSGIEGDYESKPEAEEPSQVDKKVFTTKGRSDEEVRTLSYQLFNKAFLERGEEEVSVIWNAAFVMPMETGLNIKIGGKDYITIGTLNEKHLIVGAVS
ncbi:MAG: hypothetical protein JRH13_08860 [Deltaproteobacteria bacterium]|nr:hypothetical protein [Deltaproteobacteria bacterium]MBW2017026.1 hypothetical protein [Deltaproteobacteria bacterium]MBW2129460.1 hypothetical protein [Deltaproteobacteria bacterium]MBW2302171.1 hypothetical protein [Deltaproteobacteria bacterium]